MALDVTVAGASANSYLTVDEANAFAEVDLGRFAARWNQATEAEKEKALRQAARDIDQYVAGVSRYSSTQRLRFPRAVDVTTATPAVAYIPTSVKEAQYEQAIYALANADILDDAATRRAKGMFTFSEDQGTSGSIAIDPQMGRLAPQAEFLLASFTRSRGFAGSIRVKSSVEA